jgi:hypothetical protein
MKHGKFGKNYYFIFSIMAAGAPGTRVYAVPRILSHHSLLTIWNDFVDDTQSRNLDAINQETLTSLLLKTS